MKTRYSAYQKNSRDGLLLCGELFVHSEDHSYAEFRNEFDGAHLKDVDIREHSTYETYCYSVFDPMYICYVWD